MATAFDTSCVEDDEYCTVTGAADVQILDDYMDSLPADQKVCRLFRSLYMKDSRITRKYIGVHNLNRSLPNFWVFLTG